MNTFRGLTRSCSALLYKMRLASQDQDGGFQLQESANLTLRRNRGGRNHSQGRGCENQQRGGQFGGNQGRGGGNETCPVCQVSGKRGHNARHVDATATTAGMDIDEPMPCSSSSGGADPPRILRLEESMVNHIVAGEVIQRLLLAVKELVENSLDASASTISVTIKYGDVKLIQVSYDGHCIQEHMTDSDPFCRFGLSVDVVFRRTDGFG